MKRTAIKRRPSKPKARKPMRRKITFSDLVRRALAPKRDVPLNKRTPLRRFGARGKRDQAAVTLFREAVLSRAGPDCERCNTRQLHLEAHHLVNRARCPGWPQRHDPWINGAGVCWACHRSLDLDPYDTGGPLAGRAARAFHEFEEWRADLSLDGYRKGRTLADR